MDPQRENSRSEVKAAADPAAVRRIIDQDIRPFIQADGGDIELLAIEGNTVRVRLSGACNTCPSSPQTLRLGVQNRLQEKISPDLVVEGAFRE